MMLQIFYKNGEIRKTNLHIDFFRDERVSIATRAQDIAYSHNPDPWKIIVVRNGEVKFQKIIEKNEPDAIKDKGKGKIIEYQVPANIKQMRKDAKKKYKRTPFV